MVWTSEKTLPVPNKDILSWIFDEVDYDQDKPIYVDAANPSRFITNRQARSLIRKLIAGFRTAGLQKGDAVCLHAFNDIYYSIVFLAIIGAGGIYTDTNPAYTPFELTHHVKTAHVKMIISEAGLLPGIQTAADKCNIPRSRVFVFNTYGDAVPNGFRSWDWLMQHGEQDWVRFDDEKLSANTEAARLFSSGTTGLPKAAVLTHKNFVAQYVGSEGSNPKPFPIIRLYCLPMFHAATCPTAHTATLKGGFTAYVMRRFEIEPFFQICERYQITEVHPLVPPAVVSIIMSPFNKKYSLKSVKAILIGAAPLDKGPWTKDRKQGWLRYATQKL